MANILFQDHKTVLPLFEKIKKRYYQKNLLFSCTIELTTKCQLSCKHCYLPEHRNPGISKQAIFNIINQLSAMRCLILTFTGGEIFLRDDLLDIIKYATSKNLFIRLKTNAALITEDIAKELSCNSIIQTDVSIYGHIPEIHDEVTGTVGSFEDTIRAIRFLKKYNVNVVLAAVLMDLNAPYYKEIFDMAKRFKCQISFSTRLIPRIDGNLNPMDFIAPDNIRNRILDHLITNGYRKEEIDISEKRSIKKEYLCRESWGASVYLRSNGDVSPCALIFESYGNVFNDSLSEILKNPLRDYLSHKISIDDIKKCSLCSYKDSCYNCRGLVYIETGDILGNSDFLCYYNRVLGKKEERYLWRKKRKKVTLVQR